MAIQADTQTLAARTFVDQTALLYEGGLDRSPEAFGLNGWVDVRQAGGTDLQVAQGIVGSQEYATLHAGETRAEQIDSFYENLLGRHAEPAGLAGWTNSSLSIAEILDGIASSPEALEHNATGLHAYENAVSMDHLLPGAPTLDVYGTAEQPHHWGGLV